MHTQPHTNTHIHTQPHTHTHMHTQPKTVFKNSSRRKVPATHETSLTLSDPPVRGNGSGQTGS